MLQRYYEQWVFKPLYMQCFFVCLLVLGVMAAGYFSFIQENRLWVIRQTLEIRKLEQVLQEEKKRQMSLKREKSSLYAYEAAYRYLSVSDAYLKTTYIVSKIAELAMEEQITLKHIALKHEKEEGSHRIFLIHLSLLGRYKNLTQFCFLLTQQPYLTQLMQLKLEKFKKEPGDKTLYADLFINVYVFK